MLFLRLGNSKHGHSVQWLLKMLWCGSYKHTCAAEVRSQELVCVYRDTFRLFFFQSIFEGFYYGKGKFIYLHFRLAHDASQHLHFSISDQPYIKGIFFSSPECLPTIFSSIENQCTPVTALPYGKQSPDYAHSNALENRRDRRRSLICEREIL